MYWSLKPLTTTLTTLSLILHIFISPIQAQTTTVTVAPSAEPTSPSYATPGEFQSQMLSYTNLIRSDYNASALEWNNTLAQFAQKWSKGCIFQHSGGPNGENLAEGYLNVSGTVYAWANESQYYTFDPPTGFSEQTGHFTQLVWKSTTTVGCGVTNCPPTDNSSAPANAAQGWYVVCEYYPPGNVIGDNNLYFQQNVDPPVSLGISTLVGGDKLRWTVMTGVLVILLSGWIF